MGQSVSTQEEGHSELGMGRGRKTGQMKNRTWSRNKKSGTESGKGLPEAKEI